MLTGVYVMTVEPSSPKRNILAFLTRFISTLFIAALIVWQLFALRNPSVPPELEAADRALVTKNDKQARRQFEKLIGRGAQEPGIYQVIIADCMAHGRADLGLEYGERAIDACKYASNEARAVLYLMLSEVYTLGREAPPHLKSQQYAKRALELAPDNPDTLNGYGYILADNAGTEQEVNIAFGYIQKALLILREQTTTDPSKLVQTEDSYGWALYKHGKYKPEDYVHAADALYQAIDDLPTDIPGAVQKVLYYHLGAACRAAGRPEEARHALQVALFYDPKYSEALRELSTLPPAPPPSAPAAPVHKGEPARTPPDAAASTPITLPEPTKTVDGKPIFQSLTNKK
jgi:tetratricopeptide (TPR) repeat protein